MNPKDLAKDFPRQDVHWRVQGQPYERNGNFAAMALCYVDARDVMDRFDEVCGPGGWQNKYSETASGRILCQIGVKIGDDWVWKGDGAGSTQVEGEKGGISDALKRAAVAWGVGRYLYRLDTPWVKCLVRERNGKKLWNKWDEDPWSKVANVGYTQPAAPEAEAKSTRTNNAPEPKKEKTPATVRDYLQAQTLKANTTVELETWWERKDITALQAELPEPMQNEVRKSYTDRMAAVFQAPTGDESETGHTYQ